MEYLIEAWSYVHKSHPDWKLDIYGYGELKEEMTRSIATLNLTDVININEPTNIIIQKYLESSIYIMSSRFEGFGMVLLEAMACGVPCISFDCPYGPADIIRNGEDGFLVEHLNAKALADSICQLIEQPELRKQFGRKAKKNIIRYSKDNIMKQWTELFNELTHYQ